MTRFLSRIRFAAGAFALLACLVLACVASPAGRAAAQSRHLGQPDRELREGTAAAASRCASSAAAAPFPDVRSYNIEQPAGRDWRYFHEVTLHWLGGIAILGMLGLLVLFYLIRGMVRIEAGRSGRTLVRFNMFERFVHWMTATCFVVLALSGLNITFGKDLLTPLVGAETFAVVVAMGEIRA